MQTAFLTLVSQDADFRIERIILGGPMGILGPILLVLLCLWLGRGDRSPWYIKAVLVTVLVVLAVIVFGGI